MQRVPGFEFIARAAIPAACLMIAAYFAGHALFGQTGVLALSDIHARKAELRAEHERLLESKRALDRDVALLDPRGVDPDYADELVRRHLGVVRPDEVIVPLPPETQRK